MPDIFLGQINHKSIYTGEQNNEISEFLTVLPGHCKQQAGGSMLWFSDVAERLDIDMNERKERLREVAKQPGEIILGNDIWTEKGQCLT